jgi:hypothetical protein
MIASNRENIKISGNRVIVVRMVLTKLGIKVISVRSASRYASIPFHDISKPLRLVSSPKLSLIEVYTGNKNSVHIPMINGATKI